MSRHVIKAFHCMVIIGLVFRHYMVEDLVEVMTDIWISVFVYSQTAGCVFHKYVEKTNLWKRRGEITEYFARYQVATSWKWFKSEF